MHINPSGFWSNTDYKWVRFFDRGLCLAKAKFPKPRNHLVLTRAALNPVNAHLLTKNINLRWTFRAPLYARLLISRFQNFLTKMAPTQKSIVGNFLHVRRGNEGIESKTKAADTTVTGSISKWGYSVTKSIQILGLGSRGCTLQSSLPT